MKPSELSFTPDQKAVWECLRAKYLQQGRVEMIREVGDLIVRASINGWADARFEEEFRLLFAVEILKWGQLASR